MNVRCPQCQAIFRVDPERIPTSGIRARCTRCNSLFQVDRSGAVSIVGPAATTAAPAGSQAASSSAAAATATRAPAPSSAPPPPAMATPTPPRPAAPPPPPAAPAPAAATSFEFPSDSLGGVRRPSFRNQDPNARAQRIARALVSDIVAYHKDRLKQSVAAGTVRNDFREEIRKSWEEYVEQVGLELAKSTPYFRDALNELLAQGQKVF